MFEKKYTIPAVLIIVLALSSCFSPWQGGDDAVITLHLGGANNRAIGDLYPTKILEHIIRLSGPGGEQAFTFGKGELTAKISVVPGHYDITVEAYSDRTSLEEVGEDIDDFAYIDGKYLVATGTGSVDVIAGQSNLVEIKMKWAEPVAVTGVTLNTPTLTLVVGGTATLTAAIAPSDATNKKVTWESSDDGIAEVSDTGTVTGISAGNATITVITMDGEKEATCVVTVSDAPTYSISLDKSGTQTFPAATVGSPGQTPLTVTVTNNGNQPTGNLAVSFGGNTNFTSSPTTINSITNTNGTATFAVAPNAGLAVGTYTATVTVTGANSISANFDVSFTVNPVLVETVTLNRSNPAGTVTTLPLTVGETFTLTATVNPNDATNKTVTWSSSTPAVATVANGVVTPVTTGTTTITVATADGNKTASCTVTVYAAGTNTKLKFTLIDNTAYSVMRYNDGITGPVTIPAYYNGLPVTVINASDGVSAAFMGMSNITSITIPSTVTTIGAGAFSGCTSLASVTINDGITEIPSSAFYGCSALTNITIPASVETIGFEAFFNCGLSSVTFMGEIAVISTSAFGDSTTSLKDAYTTGGAGEYTRAADGTWTKQATLNITGMSLGDIQTAIHSRFNAYQDVTVTGTLTGVTETLTLIINSGRTLTWEAEYSSSFGGYVIDVTDTGRFILKGSIAATDASGIGISCGTGATIIVDGGSITTAGYNAMQVWSSAKVIIQSGTINAGGTTSLAITVSDTAKLAIFGGTISTSYETVVLASDNSTIYLAGGTIEYGGIWNAGSATGYYAASAAGLAGMFRQGKDHSNFSPIAGEPPSPWWD